MTDVTLNLVGLDNLLKALGSARKPRIRVGVLGNSGRSDGKSNALIGAAHEFGTTRVPMRSFLRIPLAERLPGALEAAGLTGKEAMEGIVEDGSILPWLKMVAVAAEGVVAEAFDTGGFGKWPPLKAATLRRKRVHQILVETQQLRNSITSEVLT